MSSVRKFIQDTRKQVAQTSRVNVVQKGAVMENAQKKNNRHKSHARNYQSVHVSVRLLVFLTVMNAKKAKGDGPTDGWTDRHGDQ